MQLLNILATLVSWSQIWASGSCATVLLAKRQVNCTQIPLESSIASFEVNESMVTSLDGGACSVRLAPDSEFKLRAENYLFHLNNRRLACLLSIQLDDLLSNKTLSLCNWPEKILQTSLSVRVFASGESPQPHDLLEYQQQQEESAAVESATLLLTAVAFYRPRTCDEFKCRESRICIPKEAVCDGRPHCPDGSDESTTKEDNVCFQYNSDSFSRIGIVLTSALLISVGLVFAAVIRRTLLERLKKPSKYEVNPGKEIQYSECETSFMSPHSELDTF